jgi:hypothetical protein
MKSIKTIGHPLLKSLDNTALTHELIDLHADKEYLMLTLRKLC